MNEGACLLADGLREIQSFDSLSLALSLSRPLIVVPSCPLSLPLIPRSRSRSSRRPVAEREREKERKKERKRDGRASLPRERAVCVPSAREESAVYSPVFLSRLASSRLPFSSHLTTPRSTSPRLLHLVTHLSTPSTLRPLPHFVSLRLASSSRIPPLLLST